MGTAYLPRADAKALAWMKAFAGGIQARPGAYMLSPGDAAALREAVAAFERALAAVTPRGASMRSAVTVAQKDAARLAAEQLCRQYYSIIKPNGGVSDALKIEIGVRPVNPERAKIKCPQSAPMLSVLAATPGRHTLVYRDSTTPDSRAKPYGAAQLQLMVHVGDAPTGPGEAERLGGRLAGQFTRNPVEVPFDHRDDRKKATYYGRWVSSRGEVGPWSHPVSMSIVA